MTKKKKLTRVKLSLTLLVIHLTSSSSLFSQTFINGDFENKTAVVNQINIGTNAAYNGFMANSIAYGTTPNMDIMTAPTYGGYINVLGLI